VDYLLGAKIVVIVMVIFIMYIKENEKDIKTL
jgi:hypothetical protein